MKYLLILIPLLLSGCVTRKAENIFKHLKDDPAEVTFENTNPWSGTTKITRKMPVSWQPPK